MNKQLFLKRMREERENWDGLLAQVPPDRMEQPAINNGWSIKDTVAHILYYERWLLGWLEAAVRGKVTLATHRDLLDVDSRNAIVLEENRRLPLDEVLDESRRVHERLYQVVATLPEQDLLEPQRFARYVEPFWGKAIPLWEAIAGDSYRHYREHAATVRSWLEALPAEQVAA